MDKVEVGVAEGLAEEVAERVAERVAEGVAEGVVVATGLLGVGVAGVARVVAGVCGAVGSTVSSSLSTYSPSMIGIVVPRWVGEQNDGLYQTNDVIVAIKL